MRVRSCLGSRYDSREGIYDWDYHMKLQEMVRTVGSLYYASVLFMRLCDFSLQTHY